MSDEKLAKLTVPSASEGVEQAAEQAKKREELLKTVGMTNRLNHEKRTVELADQLWLAEQAYPEMTGADFRTWRAFLPTTCRLDEFNYDAVPTEALEAIKTAQQLGCFTRIIVWTPEGNSFRGALARKWGSTQEHLAKLISNLDPMAVGVVTDPYGKEHFFQIARWGEALLPFKQIKRNVWSIKARMALLFRVLPLLMAVFLIASYTVAIINFGFWPVFGTTILTIVVLIILMAIFGSA